MTPLRIALLASILALLAIDPSVRAADTPGSPGSPGPADLEKQLSDLRRDLADTRLQLQQAKTELDDIRRFLAEKNIDDKLTEWRTERAKLAEERRLLQMERTRLDASRKALHQDTTRLAQQSAADQQKQQQQQFDAAAPRWNARYEIGLIRVDNPTVYLTDINGRVFIDQYPTAERHKVKVKGSFLNRSLMPWRYTFEIRIASTDPIGLNGRKVLASWPYQTPLLTPGELHNFEVELQLKGGDIGDIDIVQIGNVTADRPADPNTPATPAVEDKSAPAR